MSIINEPKNVREFANGKAYCFELNDGFLIETTDTFLPIYTKDSKGSNILKDTDLGCRLERWMVGVSVMSGCPVGCGFCTTGKLKNYRNLTTEEIVDQVKFVVGDKNPSDSKEFKINYTRMGEPFLNIENVKKAVEEISKLYPNAFHLISTIGIKDSDFGWFKDNIGLQISLHSLDEGRRNKLIPFKSKMTIDELSKVRIEGKRKITLNLTLVGKEDFDIDLLKRFDKKYFFIKLSPINENEISKGNRLGNGIIQSKNLV